MTYYGDMVLKKLNHIWSSSGGIFYLERRYLESWGLEKVIKQNRPTFKTLFVQRVKLLRRILIVNIVQKRLSDGWI